jgi:translocation and assembly module TamB
MANRIKLDIAVQTSRDLNLASSEVSLQGQANLRVIGTAADPVIVGRTEFTGGDIFLMNKRYQIEGGIIEFSNPHRTEPVLNILLTTTINQYNLNLTFLGPLDKMRTSYVSDPPLPTADIINLMARGQTTQQADVTSTQREIIQGEYKFNKKWSASVTRDENGGFAVDGKYHKRY